MAIMKFSIANKAHSGRKFKKKLCKKIMGTLCWKKVLNGFSKLQTKHVREMNKLIFNNCKCISYIGG
jgi:hypothetical protein